MAEPVLSLDVFVPRSVAIGGTRYALLNPGGLSLVALRRRELALQRYQEIQKDLEDPARLKGLTDEEADRIATESSQLLRDMVRAVLVAPDEVLDQLGDEQRVAILQAFMQPQREEAPPAGAPPAPRKRVRASHQPPTGATGSPA